MAATAVYTTVDLLLWGGVGGECKKLHATLQHKKSFTLPHEMQNLLVPMSEDYV